MTQDVNFQFQVFEKYNVLTINPEINEAQWGEIESIGTQILQQINGHSQPNFMVDLSNLTYMGSALVALIVRVWKAVKAQNGKLSVNCPNEAVRQVIRLAALDETWNVRSDRAACFEVLGVTQAAVNQGLVSQQEGDVAKQASQASGGPGTMQLVVGVVVLLIAGVGIGMMISSDGNPSTDQPEAAEQATAPEAEQENSGESDSKTSESKPEESKPAEEQSATDQSAEDKAEVAETESPESNDSEKANAIKERSEKIDAELNR